MSVQQISRKFRQTFAVVILLIVTVAVTAQPLPADSVVIKWENGDITYLRDLKPVWIFLRTGSKLKNARLWDIDKEKGKLTYEQNLVLHDVFITDIKGIYPAEYSVNMIIFDGQNNMRITQSDKLQYYYYAETDFPVSRKYVKAPEPVKPVSRKAVTIESPDDAKLKTSASGNDTLITAQGEILPVTIIRLDDNVIRFTRKDTGPTPVYTLAMQPGTDIINKGTYIKVIFNK
jgi:hypothetical protein